MEIYLLRICFVALLDNLSKSKTKGPRNNTKIMFDKACHKQACLSALIRFISVLEFCILNIEKYKIKLI